MDMNYLTALRAALIFTPLLFIEAAQAQPMLGDAYYQNDIGHAIREAKQNRRRFDYSKKHWYNRTTARSFDFDKLKNTEMAQTTVPGALDATAAGPGDSVPVRIDPLVLKSSQISLIATSEKQNEEDNSLSEEQDAAKSKDNQTKEKEILVITEYYKEEVSVQTKYGSGSSKGIRSNTTLNVYTHD